MRDRLHAFFLNFQNFGAFLEARLVTGFAETGPITASSATQHVRDCGRIASYAVAGALMFRLSLHANLPAMLGLVSVALALELVSMTMFVLNLTRLSLGLAKANVPPTLGLLAICCICVACWASAHFSALSYTGSL